MGFLVGSSAALSTWGKFRCAWCVQSNFDVTNVQDHDITYGSGQKSAADGSGLIRWRPRPLFASFTDEYQPTIWNNVYSNFPVLPPTWGNRIFSDPRQVSATSPTGFESAAVTDELRAELNGDTVTFTTGSTTIADILWQEGVYKWNGPSPPPIVDAGDVVSIGKFTAFS